MSVRAPALALRPVRSPSDWRQLFPAAAILVGLLLVFGVTPLSRATLVLPLYVPLIDAATILCIAVICALGSMDVIARRDTRSLPLVAAAAAIGVLWLPHLFAFPILLPRLATTFSAQTASAIFDLAQLATPAILALAFVQRTGPVQNPRRAVRYAIARAVGFGLVCAGLAALLAPVLPPIVVGANFTLFHHGLQLAAMAPVAAAVVIFLSGRRGDRRLELALAAAMVLLVFTQISSLFSLSLFDGHWYATNLLRFLPIAALMGGQLALYSDSIASERTRVRQLALLQQITHDVVASLELEVVLDRVAHGMTETARRGKEGEVRSAVLRLEGEVVNVVAQHDSRGMPSSVQPFSLDADPLLADVIATGEARAGQEPRQPAAWALAAAAPAGGVRVAYAPMRSRGDIVGALGIAVSAGASIDADALVLLQGIADLAGLAIRNAEEFRTITHVASTDVLTALPNRREFERALAGTLSEDYAILTIDVDDLRSINDEYGHKAGDRVLQSMARALAQSFRGRDIVARVGGDEFAALLPGADAAVAAAVAERIRSSIRALDIPYGLKHVSIGFAAAPGGADSREVWGWADEALYHAKRRGSDRIEAFTHDLPAGTAASEWTEAIPALLNRDGVVSIYQPIVSLGDGGMIGYEALARPGGGAADMSVEGMFKTAAKIGLGSELDWFCRRAAIQGANSLPAGTLLFVNVSIPALLDPLHDVDQMLLLLRWARRQPSDVVLEISERDAVSDLARFRQVLSAYREAGFRFAIDDVGEGHSTLEVLAASTPEYIKVARKLVETTYDPGSRAAVSALVAFARTTGSVVIAEGIETDEQAREMRELGVQVGQGYRLGRPGPLLKMAPAV